ncbi:MAG TPA: T9SS type A sorting domain-containing protein, partial [Bacteroidota bacterium]
LFGSPVQSGIIGVNPSLTDLTNGNLKMQFDFRDVYASVLRQWFGVSNDELNTVLSKGSGALTQLPIILPSVTTGAEQESTLPTEYQLYTNYPNPFNPMTTIAYDLPSDAAVVLKVYDMMGREVATLVNDRQSAGKHRVQFHPNGLASGTYIYQLRAGSFTDRKRMVYLK